MLFYSVGVTKIRTKFLDSSFSVFTAINLTNQMTELSTVIWEMGANDIEIFHHLLSDCHQASH